jgi:hypothetical protein
VDKVFNKVENLFAGRWRPNVIWTFVQSIDNDIRRDLSWEIEHVLQTLCEHNVTRLF